MQYLRFRPSRLWTLDTASPYADRSGYATNATLTGSQVKGISLSRYAAYSHVVNSTNYITFPQTAYIVGKENQSFSLAASIYLPDTGTFSAQQILSNNGRTDGLAINGDLLTFSTDYATADSAVCSYHIPVNKKLDVFGVHTPTKNFLVVDGVQVDEVDITEEQQADSYATTNGNLYAGKLSSQNLLINTVGIYPMALQQEEINIIYADNNSTSDIDPYAAYVGEVIDLSTPSRPTIFHSEWNSEEDWNSGIGSSVFVDGDVLRPQMVGALTTGGTWQDSINLYDGDTVPDLQAVNLNWTGINVLVEVSPDGTSWETAVKNAGVSFIYDTVDLTDVSMSIRVTFTAGADEAYIENLEVKAYDTETIQQPSNRVITIGDSETGATFDSQVPAQLCDDWGTLVNDGSITIGQDLISELPMDVKTVEIWSRRISSSVPTPSANLTTGTTVYTNGIAGSTTRRGEWYIQHYTKSTPITGDLVLTGAVHVGQIVLYDSQLTATQVSNVVANYLGRGIGNRSSGGSIGMAEHNPPANIYAHDWYSAS